MFSSRCLQHGLHVKPQCTADADAWDDSIFRPHANRSLMYIEVLGEDFGAYERRGVGDSRRVSALLRLLSVRDFCSHESGFFVNWWVVHTPPYLYIFSAPPKVNAQKSHFVNSAMIFHRPILHKAIKINELHQCRYPCEYM
jgi:hypothetical protein